MNKRVVWLVVLAFTLVLAIAAPALAVTFSGIVTVQVSTNTTYSYYPAYINMDNSFLAAHYYTLPSLLDVKVEDTGNTSLAMMPTENRTWFIPTSLAANSITSFRWSSANTPKSSHEVIVGNGGYVTVLDNAKWEPADNFVLEIGLYLKNANYTVLNKLNALRIDYSASTSILTLTIGTYASPMLTLTAAGVTPGLHTIRLKTDLTTSGGATTETIYPTGAGDAETIPLESPNGKPHYQILASFAAVGAPCYEGMYPDHGDDYVYADWYYGPSGYDLFTFTIPGIASLSSVKLNVYGDSSGSLTYLTPKIKQPGYSLWTGNTLPFGSGYNATIHKVNIATLNSNPVTGAPWAVSDLTNIQFGFALAENSFGVCPTVGFEVELMTSVIDTMKLELYVDNMGTAADSDTLTAPIPDNANNWVLYPDPYINYFAISTAN